MGFDTGTLIRAAGSGLVGHKQGQLAARDRADFEAREAEDAQTRDIQRQMDLVELEMMRNPVPKPDTYTIRETASGTVRINDRSGEVTPLTKDGEQVQPRPRPQTLTSVQRFDSSDGMSTFDPSTGKVEPLLGPGGDRMRGVSRAANLSDLGSRLDKTGQAISQARQRAKEFGENEEDAANKVAREAGFQGLDDFLRINQSYLQAILGRHGLGGDGPGGGGTGVGTVGPESRARKLKDQGLSDDEIVEIGRSEGWIQG